jgi:hypothetical protein
MSIVSKFADLIRVTLSADSAIMRGAVRARKQAHGALGLMARAALACGPITSAIFDAEIRKPMSEAMKDSKRYSNGSRKALLSYHCKAIIGLSNGIKPLDDENEQSFVKRIAPELVQRKLYIAANKGGNGGKRKSAKGDKRDGKSVTITRDGALVKLVGNDAAKRQAVDYLVKNHMDKLLALYATLVPADKVA